ncbi:DUF1801 domain-containing protein [Ilumatobacter sp.]|uniref:DUF1801 domain-containing protein n=1 Tax=Ilumatobacter sp. TaxID=1967498 RepID=UPI003C4A2C2A
MTTGDDITGEVKLLSGGNPQIPKGDGDAPVQAYLAAMPDWKGEIGRHLDALVDEIVPDVRKAVRWNSPFYGVDGNGWFLSLHCFTKYVKVTWLNGSQLDPLPPGTSKSERVRYSNIAAVDDIDDDQFRDWIRQAAAAPGDELF